MYGCGLWHTWLDRDLTLVGRVILKAPDGSFKQKLVKVSRPLIHVPTLAIHLNRTVNCDGFKPNLENHLAPLLATKCEETTVNSDDKKSSSSTRIVHHPLLLQVLSEEIGCGSDEIIGMALNVCDTQPSCLGGGNNEFIYFGRLDNLASCDCALRSLMDSSKMPEELFNEKATRMVAFFDNEEDGTKQPVQENRDESMPDVNDREGSKTTSGCTQHDKLYPAEGILDPHKKKAEKKRLKGNKFSVLNDMDADYDLKVDYQMKDAPAGDGNDSKGGDEPRESEPMTGLDDA